MSKRWGCGQWMAVGVLALVVGVLSAIGVQALLAGNVSVPAGGGGLPRIELPRVNVRVPEFGAGEGGRPAGGPGWGGPVWGGGGGRTGDVSGFTPDVGSAFEEPLSERGRARVGEMMERMGDVMPEPGPERENCPVGARLRGECQ